MDIAKVSTNDLLEEVMSRYNDAIFIGIQNNGENINTYRKYKGASFTLAGLCAEGQREVLADFKNRST